MLVERTLGGVHAFLADIVKARFPLGVPSVLDLGCGSGAWLNRISQTVHGPVVGVDYSAPQPVEGLDLRRFDINTDAKDSLGCYALVTCIEVIEHIENIGRLLDVLEAPTAPSGLAIVTTPNIESLRARVRALVSGKIPSFDDKSDPTHLMPILCESLQKMLARRNMYIVETLQHPVDRARSLQYRKSVQWVAKVSQVWLPDKHYGDTAVHIIQHRGYS